MSTREVELTGGAPWGFRMHGGVDQNQPLRISRVNPGRKASLSGIREGDVISSINGCPTKGLSNAEAHTMLRTAGAVLKLGLNEDRESSPRKKSFGKNTELKRPSQLYSEVQKAIPQAPVYATIRPSRSPQSRHSFLHSQAALNSTPLVKSVAEDAPKIHPTNPFYTTLPSNYTSASKLPVPNGRASFSGIEKTKKQPMDDFYSSDLKSSTFFKTSDSNTSLPVLHHDESVNGFNSGVPKFTANESSDSFSNNKSNHHDNQSLPNNGKNPFGKRNSDPFEKYLRQENINGTCDSETKFPGSQSENNFNRREEITKTCTITEEKISEIEEVKTIKKIILNGSGDETDKANLHLMGGSPKLHKYDSSPQKHQSEEYSYVPKDQQTIHTPRKWAEDYSQGISDYRNGYSRNSFSEQKNDNYSSLDRKEEIRNFCSPSSSYHTAEEFKSPTVETSEAAGKPPLKPETAAAASSPPKRE